MEENKEYHWCVYMHTNKLNGKKYIGITSKSTKARWGINGNNYLVKDASGNYVHPAMAHAINKYNDWDNDWLHDIVYDNLTEIEAKSMEVELIAKYKTNCRRYNNPTYGYNCTDGGEGSAGRIASKETKEKIRKRAIERLLDPNNNPSYGSGEPVVQLTTDGRFVAEFVSASEAGKINNVHEGPIRASCYSKTGSPYGYIWLFKKDYNPNNTYKPGNKIFKQVVQLTKTGEFVSKYDSVIEASKATNVAAQSISNCCNGDILSAGDFIWVYLNDYDETKQYLWKNNLYVGVIQLTMDNIFIAKYESINDAGRKTGISPSSIGKCCNHIYKSSGGYKWIKEDEYKQYKIN